MVFVVSSFGVGGPRIVSVDRLIEIGLSYILFFPSLSLSLGYRYTYIVGLGFLRGMRNFFSKFHSINRLFNDLSFFLIRLFDSMEIRINLFKKNCIS